MRVGEFETQLKKQEQRHATERRRAAAKNAHGLNAHEMRDYLKLKAECGVLRSKLANANAQVASFRHDKTLASRAKPEQRLKQARSVVTGLREQVSGLEGQLRSAKVRASRQDERILNMKHEYRHLFDELRTTQAELQQKDAALKSIGAPASSSHSIGCVKGGVVPEVITGNERFVKPGDAEAASLAGANPYFRRECERRLKKRDDQAKEMGASIKQLLLRDRSGKIEVCPSGFDTHTAPHRPCPTLPPFSPFANNC